MSDTSITTLPEGWVSVPIGKIAQGGIFTDGDWVESKDQDPGGQVRLTQLADVGEGEFRDRSNRWLRDDQAERLGVTYLEQGDLMIARMPDPLGRCCVVPKLDFPAVTVVDVALLRIRRSDTSSRYVMWCLNSPTTRQAMESIASGTTRVRISRKNLSTVEIPFPPLAEQEKIVEILEEQLSRLDAALVSVRTVRKKAAQFRRSLLRAAFIGALTGHDTSSGDLPNGWKKVDVGEVVEFLNGYAFKSDWYKTSGIRLVRGQNISHGFLDWEDTKRIEIMRANEFSRFELRKGDILVSLDRPLISTGLKWAIVQDSDLPALLLQRVARISPKEDRIRKEFLQIWVQSPFFTDGINPGRSNGIPHISTKELASLAIPVPPLDQQEKIVEILEEQLSRLDASLAAAHTVELRVAALRRSLLHAAFTGQITKQWRESNL